MLYKSKIVLLVIFFIQDLHAAIDITNSSDWKFSINGFIESALLYDTTRSFRETPNGPVARPGTFNGDNGRTQISVRDTRFVLSVLPPDLGEFKHRGILAIDFLGYNPNPSTSAPNNTETSFYINPTPRLLLAFYSIEKNNWKFISGLGGSLFGWAPNYFLTTVSTEPVTGTIYLRTPQLTAIKSIPFEGANKLQLGLSISRPTQRDSEIPNLDAGARFSFGERKAAIVSPGGDIGMQTATVAVSGTFRQFKIPSSLELSSESHIRKDTGAIALNALMPLLSSPAREGNSLALTAEYSIGAGYSEHFIGSTGNIAQLPAGSAGSQSSVTNLDPGQGGFDTNGSFTLAKLRSWNAQLQYHLPMKYKSFANLGFTEWRLRNPQRFNPAPGLVLYDKSQAYFINFFYDITEHVRVAFEYANFSTHYIDGVSPEDNRLQVSTWFRF